MDKAKLDALGHASLAEALGERFHASPALLRRLNPELDRATAGTVMKVPAVAGPATARAARVVVDRSESVLRLLDDGGRVLAQYPASTGSEHDPLPIGDWDVKGKAYNPPYSYDPALLRGAPASNGKHQLPPGPNSPVGVVWIDLTKDHYGIHGTPSPDTIGTAESNGCVRLTNWDAARLAQMVSGSTKVEFRK
mgnify:CR=1 FL=1